MRSLSMLVHGTSKTGKSYLADTTPAPRLVLDAESGAGTRFTPSKKVTWDPMSYAPPVADGSWETCVVHVRSFPDMARTYQWLATGDHPFRSIVIDSISDVQEKCIQETAGIQSLQIQDWGEVLRQMSHVVRDFRDLIMHPTHPIELFFATAMTREVNGRFAPYVRGQLATLLPYLFDVVGYLYVVTDVDTGEQTRHLLVSPTAQFEAGERTGRLPGTIREPNVQTLMDMVFAEEATA